jgi:biopolymer transport protein ExbD
MCRLLIILFLTSVFLHSVVTTEAETAGAATVINVAKSGAITIGTQRIKLKDLLATLRKMGITSSSQIFVRGDEGAKFQDISSVLETLVNGGLLPKDAID